MRDLKRGLSTVFLIAVLSLTAPGGRALAASLDREATWDGDLSFGVAFVKGVDPATQAERTEPALGVSGALRYWLTDHVALGPSVSGAFADTVKLYTGRGLLRLSTIAAGGRRPLEIYLEAGAGAIVIDVEGRHDKAHLDVPFGGGFNWRAGRNWGIFGGTLLNVTTIEGQTVFPEFYGGLWLALR